MKNFLKAWADLAFRGHGLEGGNGDNRPLLTAIAFTGMLAVFAVVLVAFALVVIGLELFLEWIVDFK